jgi:hypothetical protein
LELASLPRVLPLPSRRRVSILLKAPQSIYPHLSHVGPVIVTREWPVVIGLAQGTGWHLLHLISGRRSWLFPSVADRLKVATVSPPPGIWAFVYFFLWKYSSLWLASSQQNMTEGTRHVQWGFIN